MLDRDRQRRDEMIGFLEFVAFDMQKETGKSVIGCG